MKRIISIFTVCMLLCNVNVSAMSLSEMTEKLMEYYKIELSEDTSAINKLQNRRNVKNPKLVSTAMNNGIIVARNGLVNENGTDFEVITDGLIRRYVNDENYKFLSGIKVDLLRNQGVKFDENTFFVTENSNEADIDFKNVYTCVVNRENTALFVWKSGDVVKPAVYRVKLYWVEKDEMIVSEIYRKEFDLWIRESKNQLYSLDCSQIAVSRDFIMENLDKYVYVFADSYGGNIKVKGISR